MLSSEFKRGINKLLVERGGIAFANQYGRLKEMRRLELLERGLRPKELAADRAIVEALQQVAPDLVTPEMIAEFCPEPAAVVERPVADPPAKKQAAAKKAPAPKVSREQKAAKVERVNALESETLAKAREQRERREAEAAAADRERAELQGKVRAAYEKLLGLARAGAKQDDRRGALEWALHWSQAARPEEKDGEPRWDKVTDDSPPPNSWAMLYVRMAITDAKEFNREYAKVLGDGADTEEQQRLGRKTEAELLGLLAEVDREIAAKGDDAYA